VENNIFTVFRLGTYIYIYDGYSWVTTIIIPIYTAVRHAERRRVRHSLTLSLSHSPLRKRRGVRRAWRVHARGSMVVSGWVGAALTTIHLQPCASNNNILYITLLGPRAIENVRVTT